MDIVKYIGQFLIKNKYCSLSGLGVFDLKKNSASISNQEAISPSTYHITFTSVGSIDDTFASFIATMENVSISNTSNNIKNYCIAVKEELNTTGKYKLDSIGELYMQNGKITFKQSDDFDLGLQPVPIPMVEIKTNVNEQGGVPKLDYSYPPASTHYGKKSFVSAKVLVPIVVVALIGVFMVFRLLQSPTSNANPSSTTDPEALELNSSSTHDTTATTDAPTTTASVDANGETIYKVVVLTSTNEALAKTKAAKWKNYGNITNVISRDGSFLVTMDASYPKNDTVRLVDSLRHFFDLKGAVYILK